MKRIVTVITLFVALFISYAIPSFAMGEEYIEDFSKISGLGAEDIENIGAGAVIEEILASLRGQRGDIISFLFFVLGSLFFLAVAGEGFGNRNTERWASCAVSVGIFMNSYKLFIGVCDTLKSLGDFFSASTPIMCGITLAGGGVGTASVEALGMGLAISFISVICIPVLVPCAFVMLALSAFSPVSVVTERTLVRLRAAFLWAMGIVTAAFAATVSLQNVIATAKDGALIRAAKYSTSGLIPIVGSAVSSSLSTLGAGLAYARGIVGAGAVYTLFTIVISPLLLLLVYRGILSLAATLSELVGIGEGRGPYSVAAVCFDAVSAVYAVCAVLFFFELILFIKSGVAIA